MVSHSDRVMSICDELFGPAAERDFGIRLWDGRATRPPHRPAFTLVLNRPSALRSMFMPPSELAVGEAYIRADYDLEGDIEAAPGLSDVIFGRLNPIRFAKIQAMLSRLPEPDDDPMPGRGATLDGDMHTLERDSDAVCFHYDIPPEFWELWLDERMVYSCAYWADPEWTIDQAQANKLDLVCRKLRLKPGDTLLDIGCGWGSLIIYAAERFGVHATGITLSREQTEVARKRIAAAGLTGRVVVEQRDYRDIEPGRTFDKIASLGMVEHVGHEMLKTYFDCAWQATKPGGLFLCHGITNTSIGAPSGWQANLIQRVWKDGGFFFKYIFPDSAIPTPTELTETGQRVGYELRDFESLREHYPLTLRGWRHRLEERETEISQIVGHPTWRAWRFYLATTGWAFSRGRLGLGQVLLSRPDADHKTHLPLTRDDLWASA